MSQNAIDIRNLQKSYHQRSKGEAPAVQNLNLTIREGEVWALIGPNGAGKTTTLHCLTGLFNPDAGEIKIFDQDPRIPEARAMLGFQSEIFFTYAYLTAFQALQFYARLNGMSEIGLKKSIEDVLSTVGLLNVQHHKTSSFSKGMLQRLGLAQSLIHEPKLIIWDEPSSGLDPEGRKLVIDLLQNMKSNGKTVLFSTHILNDIEKVCDHVAILNHGKILLADSIENVLSKSSGKNLEDIYLEYIQKDNHA